MVHNSNCDCGKKLVIRQLLSIGCSVIWNIIHGIFGIFMFLGLITVVYLEHRN